jgi:hypothetical protein
MIDKSDTETAAIKEHFKDATVIICLFHVAQAWQRWIRTGDNKIPGKCHLIHPNNSLLIID